jgi:hypothetical protein
MRKSPISALLLLASIWFNVACVGAEAQFERQVSNAPRVAPAILAGPKAVAIRRDASELESFAANEVRRYVYLRSGKLLPVKRGAVDGDRIVVSCKNTNFCGGLGNEVGPQQFTLKSGPAGGKRVWWVVGGDEVGTLYGAYRFAEKLGVRFGLDEDVVPDEPWVGNWPEINETGRPRFALRGLQPFHDFSVGPDWWNLQDYQSVLSQMAKLRMNFIGLLPDLRPMSGSGCPKMWTRKAMSGSGMSQAWSLPNGGGR